MSSPFRKAFFVKNVLLFLCKFAFLFNSVVRNERIYTYTIIAYGLVTFLPFLFTFILSSGKKRCKHETVLEEYIPTVHDVPSKMQSLINLSLICTSLICGTVMVFISLNTTSLIVMSLPE